MLIGSNKKEKRMAMINCSECGKDISDKAAACIGCGAPIVAVTIPQQETSCEEVSSSEGGRMSRAAKSFGSFASKVGDLNGDGKVDAEDFKIAAARAREAASMMADKASQVGKVALQSDVAKEAVAGAAVGAVIGGPMIGGPITATTGASIGAVLGAYKGFTKK